MKQNIFLLMIGLICMILGLIVFRDQFTLKIIFLILAILILVINLYMTISANKKNKP
ncbi:MAG: hypothetical protein ABIY35_01010 [Chitinophagaceae bacterium]